MPDWLPVAGGGSKAYGRGAKSGGSYLTSGPETLGHCTSPVPSDSNSPGKQYLAWNYTPFLRSSNCLGLMLLRCRYDVWVQLVPSANPSLHGLLTRTEATGESGSEHASPSPTPINPFGVPEHPSEPSARRLWACSSECDSAGSRGGWPRHRQWPAPTLDRTPHCDQYEQRCWRDGSAALTSVL